MAYHRGNRIYIYLVILGKYVLSFKDEHSHPQFESSVGSHGCASVSDVDLHQT